MLVQLFLSGIATGSLYALIALAMVLIYRSSKIPNFALGETGMICAFLNYSFLQAGGFSPLIAFVCTLLLAALIGIAFEFFILRRAKQPDLLNLMIMTLGFQLVLYGVAGWKWGADPRLLPFPVWNDVSIELGGGVVSGADLLGVCILAGAVILLAILFRGTRIGLALRATQQNWHAARFNGIRTSRLLGLTFGLSSVLGALAALLIAPVSTLEPSLMWAPLIKGFAAAVLGGMTSPVGALVGGWLLGILENYFAAYIAPDFKSVVAFAIIIAVLCIRPAGLFGHHYERKV